MNRSRTPAPARVPALVRLGFLARVRVSARASVLACSVVGAAVVALDGTVLTVAQPALQRDLHADVGQVQWTSTGYLVAVASLLVFAGRLGDRHGHRRVFAVGALGFAAASAGIALAPGIEAVIALRVLQGVCGALLQPATLGMLRTAFPPDRLATPIAVRTAVIGLAAAAGPLVGGALVSAYGWRSVFLLSVPPTLAIGLLALATRQPEAEARSRAAPGLAVLDPLGALLLAAALGLLVHGLVEAARPGGAVPGALACAGAAVAGTALARHERRAAHPLLPPELLRSVPVVAGVAALLAASAALFGALFVTTYFLQDVQRLDPLTCALRFLPLALLMVLGAPLCPPLQRRHGPRRTATAGAALLTLGALLLSRLDATAGALPVGGCAALLGAGFVTLMVTATSVVVHRAPEAHAGVAGGLQQTAMNVGPALGVAIVTLLLALVPDGGFVPAEGAALPALAAIAALTLPAALALPGGTRGTRPEQAPPRPGRRPCVRS
ncbi:MFS transporter [Streptomyces cinereoruber]|uniref:MFS transporter n=2 Tax=Streptomyces cinereoruber TaxID=67260 RepID=A0AAV4KEV0_9ACTN|nr:MFS transporter [Streptomyces cinereoruber]MBB4161322.1 EmrB/QacA subfamily drug resistance transporter [Streptomyces cinereoruber]MBY8819855.1 MFS transporter [Streptomyces cinereoruber]NIH63700.1 EmrB/QacA subfamily drug resistance transporter [Streptomyces cinereoruber]QEV36313.1 MFS transporter [Streptomyces cinereoruber]GGR12122.1 MFS transporter [Streptomyces cinereoruber]